MNYLGDVDKADTNVKVFKRSVLSRAHVKNLTAVVMNKRLHVQKIEGGGWIAATFLLA